MPIHDWTRAEPGSFHHMHNGWITRLADALNGGLLPEPYYAGAEQVAAGTIPDVLTLERATDAVSPPASGSGGLSVVEVERQVDIIDEASADAALLHRKNQIVIRHADGDRVVALIEIVSPANKASRRETMRLVEKVVEAVESEIHVLLVDLLPPGVTDPDGLHSLIWQELAGRSYSTSPDSPLTLAAYRSVVPVKTYVQPTAVGLDLREMPLFFEPDRYVPVPLEATYASTVQAMPRPWRQAIGAA